MKASDAPTDEAVAEAALSARAHKRAWQLAAVAVVTLLVLAAAAWFYFAKHAAHGTYAHVHLPDGSSQTLDLSHPTRVRFETERGYNVVEVSDGQVFVSDADCDNHDCMEQGAISHVGEKIICLPHEFWIEIEVANADGADGAGAEGSSQEGGYDAVSR